MLFLILLTSPALPCTWYVYDDYGDGSTDGRQSGGTFVSGGWRPDGGTITYDLPELVSGTVTMRLSNVDEDGVSQADLLEMFSGADGSFSDGNRDNFLQVKYAGDIYDGYDGRVKLQAGPELYGDAECGGWTSEYDWNPDASYDFTISWTGTSASLDIAGTLSTSLDATPCDDIGPLSFSTLRVPNDGSYARDVLMDDIVIAGVSVCGDEAPSDADTDTDADTDADSDTDTDTDADADADSDADGDTDADAASVPVITRFLAGPADARVGDRWVVKWAVSGSVDTTHFCYESADTGVESCLDLGGPMGLTRVETDTIAPGSYTATVRAQGPGGEATSETTTLTLSEATGANIGCATTGGWSPVGGLLLGLAGLAGWGRRRVGCDTLTPPVQRKH